MEHAPARTCQRSWEAHLRIGSEAPPRRAREAREDTPLCKPTEEPTAALSSPVIALAGICAVYLLQCLDVGTAGAWGLSAALVFACSHTLWISGGAVESRMHEIADADSRAGKKHQALAQIRT